MTEDVYGLPDSTEGALALSKERLAAASGKPSTPPEPTAAGKQPEATEAADQDAEAGATPPDGQPAKPKADYSFVADPVLRTAFEGSNLPDTVQKAMRKWAASYTQATQKASELEKRAIEMEEVEALIRRDPALRAAFANALTGGTPQPEKKFDWTQASNEEIEAEIERKAEARAKAAAESVLEAKVLNPQKRAQAILQRAASLWPEYDGKLTYEQFTATWDEAVSHYGDTAFTPENVERLFKPFVERAVLSGEIETLKGAKAKDAERAIKATSPAGTSAVAPTQRPKAPAPPDGKAQTARERTLAALREKYGWTEDDLERSARSIE